MAKLDLIPNLEIMLIQGAMFGVAAALVKTQFVAPYLKLRDRRTLLTEGSKQSATELLKECDTKVAQIQDRIKEAMEAAQRNKAQRKDSALADQARLITDAEKFARNKINQVESEIKIALEGELKRAPALVSKLTAELYTIAIN